MSYTDHVALLRKAYEAMAAHDRETVVGVVADDGLLHVNTEGPFGGDHQGHDAIARLLGGLFEWTGGTLRMEVDELFADDQHGVVLLTETSPARVMGRPSRYGKPTFADSRTGASQSSGTSPLQPASPTTTPSSHNALAAAQPGSLRLLNWWKSDSADLVCHVEVLAESAGADRVRS